VLFDFLSLQHVAERAVKVNCKVVNERLLIALNGTGTSNYDSRPTQYRRYGKLWWAYPPKKQNSNNINQWSFYQIFRMLGYPAQTKNPLFDDFLSTDLDTQFISFLPRRIEDSATATWVYTRGLHFFAREPHKLLYNSSRARHSMIVSGYVTFCQINKCFVNMLLFHY